METAVAYIRVSSQRQVEEGGSLGTQTKLVERHAVTAGYRLARIFREEGESAKTDQRPALQELLRYCRDRKHGVQVVVVPKIDRLARNVADYTGLKVQLARQSIRLDSIGERIEDTPVGRFTETILASVAQFDNEIRAERSKGGMIDAVSQGRWVWRAPTGYRTVRAGGKGTIEPHPHFAPLIRTAFHNLASGRHSPTIVREFLKKSGLPLTKPTFYRLISNELYIGRIHAFDKVFPAQPPFLPLIDEITFHRAQSALRRKKAIRRYQRDSSEFPLRGTARCICSHLFTAAMSRGAQGKTYPYYYCIHCKGRSHPKRTVESWFGHELSAYEGQPIAWDRLRTRLLELEQQDFSNNQELRASNLSQVETLQKLRDAVALKNASGVIPDDVAMRQIQLLTEQIADVAATVPTEGARASMDGLLTFAQGFFKSLQWVWPGMPLQRQKDLLRFMFPNGILYLPDAGFRNSEFSLSERFKRTIADGELSLVDPDEIGLKELREWLQQLYRLMSEEE